MGNPLSTSDAPAVVAPVKDTKVYIKNGNRIFPSSDGVMHMPAPRSKKMFGKMKGGRYSKLQAK